MELKDLHCAGCAKCVGRPDITTGEQCVAKYSCSCHYYLIEEDFLAPRNPKE